MKVIFNKPKKASLSIVRGIYDDCGYLEWIGPRWFNIWGYPSKKRLKSSNIKERTDIFDIAERIYKQL